MKQTSRLFSLLVLAAAFVTLTGTACQKKTPDRAWERGAFQPVSANIESYSLPDGVSVGTISSYEEDWSTSFLPLFMTVSNNKANDVDVTFPAGLVFGTSDGIYQYMMVLQDYTFTVAAGADQDTVVLSTYGCNEDLDDPDDDASYSIKGREWDKETEEMLNILAEKSTITGDDNIDLVQTALYEITDGSGLTDSTKTQLQALP